MTSNVSQFRKYTKIKLVNRIRYFFQKFRLGSLGKNVFIGYRVLLLRFSKNIFIKDNVFIKDFVNICSCNPDAIIKIGSRTTIGNYTFIYSSNRITIGDDCNIAPFVYIVDSNHGTQKSKKINLQPNYSSPVEIGDDVWIGTGAKILMGVKIGNGAVISAGSVVTRNVEPYSIVGGIPAKVISVRK